MTDTLLYTGPFFLVIVTYIKAQSTNIFTTFKISANVYVRILL